MNNWPLLQVDPASAGGWLNLVSDYGLATVLLFLLLISLGLGFWKLANWSGTNILIPLKNAAIQHLDDLRVHLTNSDETMRAVKTSMQTMETTLVSLDTSHKTIHAKLDEIGRSSRKPIHDA